MNQLLKDYDYHMHPDHQEEIRYLLQMCAVANKSHIPTSLTWVRENITADENDP